MKSRENVVVKYYKHLTISRNVNIMIADIKTIQQVNVSEYGECILVVCYPIIESPFGFGGCIDKTHTIQILYPNMEQNWDFLRKAQYNEEEYFEFAEISFKKEFISIGQCYTHKSLFEKSGISCNIAGSAIDLGLSVLWANMNVGASVPTDYGALYGYGDVSGEMITEDEEAYPKTDIVNTENDIAKNSWGNDWRMPTIDELEELRMKCRWWKVNRSGIMGSEVTGPNGNCIFLPFAGWRKGLDLVQRGRIGEMWAGNLSSFGSPVDIMFHSLRGSLNYGACASRGCSIRPVKDR